MSQEGGFKNAALKGRPEGANSNMRDKVKPNGIREGGSQFGTTFEKSSPARFPNTGSSQKKKGASTDTIHCGPNGTTFVCDDPAVNFPSSMKGARRNKTEKKTEPGLSLSDHESARQGSASQKSGSGEPTTKAYPLAKDYEKRGRKAR